MIRLLMVERCEAFQKHPCELVPGQEGGKKAAEDVRERNASVASCSYFADPR